jgi:hypothetical protein
MKINIFSIIILFFLANSALANCSRLIVVFQNDTNETLSADLQAPLLSSNVAPASGIAIKPGERYPWLIINRFNSLTRAFSANTWIGLQFYNSKRTSLIFNGMIVKLSPSVSIPTWSPKTVNLKDPAGAVSIEKYSFDDKNYDYTEQFKFDGRCSSDLPGMYMFKISKSNGSNIPVASK